MPWPVASIWKKLARPRASAVTPKDVATDLARGSEQVGHVQTVDRPHGAFEQLVLQPRGRSEVCIEFTALHALVAQGCLEHAGAMQQRATQFQHSLARAQARREFLGAVGGLVRKSSAPASKPATRSATSSRAVTSTI